MRFKSQEEHFYDAHKHIAESNRIFMFDILPNITKEEFEKLCQKRPGTYEKYRGVVDNELRHRSCRPGN